jgi:hypothetical protein
MARVPANSANPMAQQMIWLQQVASRARNWSTHNLQSQQSNPLYSRNAYTTVYNSPVLGPMPQVTRNLGTGHSALGATPPGQTPLLPGYVTQNEYQPSLDEYQPALNETFEAELPRTINVGTNGRELVGTYEPHDWVQADRFNHQLRSAPNWQIMSFPPGYRQLLQWQQVMRYQVQSQTIAPRPIRQSDYFLGYVTDPSVAAKLGGNTLGYMGSQ